MYDAPFPVPPMTSAIRRPVRSGPALAAFAALAWTLAGSAQTPAPPGAAPPDIHAATGLRLVIRNAMVIYGSRRPPFGPVDIVSERGVITAVAPAGTRPVDADAVIDAGGRYVMPGLVNTHMHWHEDRQPGLPQPVQYERNLYLAAGVTTTRELGGNFDRSRQWQAESDAHTIVAPRMLVYAVVSRARNETPAAIRTAVREAARRGADGLKIIALDRDQLEAALDEAQKASLKTTAHIGAEETTVDDYIELGVNSIEHFYGVADAALGGVQQFPAATNHSNEIHRFARAGELYAQADPAKLRAAVARMAAAGVGWTPTFSIYEANRDLRRAQHQPWFADYLHPSLEAFFRPSLARHGSYFLGWTSTQEARWKQQFRIWMDAVREFGRQGGLIATGDDAGFIYSLYGFGMSRELELHEEAGFHPLEVIEHATWNGARMLGLDHRIGRVREGYAADLLVVNGNPIENLKLLNPYGTDVMVVNGRPVPNDTAIAPADRVGVVRGGGIEWTIKDGIPYHVPTLLQEVRDMVSRARRPDEVPTP
jgi:imidazolonepropionase-like amidohydrolase